MINKVSNIHVLVSYTGYFSTVMVIFKIVKNSSISASQEHFEVSHIVNKKNSLSSRINTDNELA